MKSIYAFVAALSLLLANAQAQVQVSNTQAIVANTDDQLGRYSLNEFKACNEIAALKLQGVKATEMPAPSSDQQYAITLAQQARRQLQMAQYARGRMPSEKLNLLAASMVDEQQMLLQKLEEWCKAKKMFLGEKNAVSALKTQPVDETRIGHMFLDRCAIYEQRDLLSLLQQGQRLVEDASLKAIITALLPSVSMRLQIGLSLKEQHEGRKQWSSL